MIPELEVEEKTESRKKLLVQTLPYLEKGVNLIEADSGLPIFQVLVANELSTGKAVWIDQEDHASSFQMARAGGEDILSDIMVSRSYTPYQHYNTVMNADRILDQSVEVLVMPSVNLMYEDGQLRGKEREDLFEDVIQKLQEYVKEYDLKVLTSLSDRVAGELEFRVRAVAEKTVGAEVTAHGLKFDSEDFSSQIYRSNGKIQTTVPLFTSSAPFMGEVEIVGEDERNLQAAPGAVL